MFLKCNFSLWYSCLGVNNSINSPNHTQRNCGNFSNNTSNLCTSFPNFYFNSTNFFCTNRVVLNTSKLAKQRKYSSSNFLLCNDIILEYRLNRKNCYKQIPCLRWGWRKMMTLLEKSNLLHSKRAWHFCYPCEVNDDDICNHHHFKHWWFG